MEEFANNGQRDNADIILPAEKKLTLTPIHDDVHEDDTSDAQIAAGHANSGPIGNIASDMETTGLTAEAEQPLAAPSHDEYVPPKPAPHVAPNRHPYQFLITLIVIVVVLLAILLIPW